MPSIIVTGRDDRVASHHKQHAEKKISKLKRYFGGIVRIEAILAHSDNGAAVELVISVRRGKPLVCRSRSTELYAAIDLVLDKAEAQLTRHKEKLKGRKVESGRGRRAGQILSVGESPGADGNPGGFRSGEAESPAMEEEESYQDIVEKRDFS